MIKCIWTYWNSSTWPKIVYLCQKSWHRNFKDYDIRVLSEKTFLAMQPDIDVSLFRKLTPQQQSDYVRLYLLAEYGGIWMDCTILAISNLKWLEEKFEENKLVLFRYNENPYLVESWFIAAREANHEVMTTWKQTYRTLLYEAYQDGVLAIHKSPLWGKMQKKGIKSYMQKYLAVYVVHDHCVRTIPSYKLAFMRDTLLLDNYLVRSSCTMTFFGLYSDHAFPFIKFTKWERSRIQLFGSYRLRCLFHTHTGCAYIYGPYMRLALFILLLIIIFSIIYIILTRCYWKY